MIVVKVPFLLPDLLTNRESPSMSVSESFGGVAAITNGRVGNGIVVTLVLSAVFCNVNA